MSIFPPGTPLTIVDGSGPTTYILAVDSVIVTATTEEIIRQEFTNKLQQEVKESDGSMAIFDETAKNKKFQIFTGCGPETARPTIPDDSNLNDIFNRFDIVKLEIEGTDSLPADVLACHAISKSHQPKYARYKNFFNKVKSDISIGELTTLQGETFSYLTSTGISLSMPALAGYTFTDVLLLKFDVKPTIEYPNNSDASSSTVYQSFSAEIEVRKITTADNTSWEGE